MTAQSFDRDSSVQNYQWRWNMEQQGLERFRNGGEPAGTVMQTFNPSTPEAKMSGSLGVSGQPSLHKEFQDSQG